MADSNRTTFPTQLGTRFAISLSDYIGRTGSRHSVKHFDSLVESIASSAEGVCTGRVDYKLAAIATKGVMAQLLAGTVRESVCRAAKLCESPIEFAMLFAIGIASHSRRHAVLYDFGDGAVFGDAEGDCTVRIQPQVPFQAYRVDLLVSLQTIDEIGDDLRVLTKQVVIECDGHEFHERTKEQAARDRGKDRELQRIGLNVFRYTGSEIWADAFKCAEQVLEYLHSNLEVLGKKPPASETAARRTDGRTSVRR
jgi:very-short-patch-repair endonuclease